MSGSFHNTPKKFMKLYLTIQYIRIFKALPQYLKGLTQKYATH